ncbi:MAG: outer membrane beta-barrel protein [Halobacteriovoraceae bacterium]|nr:outer membrane beta-barrel protein [Halobacteriovoraceae bacterium]
MLRIKRISALLFGALLVAGVAKADNHMSQVNIHGTIDANYTYNSSNNVDASYHAYNTDNKGFSVGLVDLNFSGSHKKVDWLIDFARGEQTVTAGANDDISQAYLRHHINDMVSVTIGRLHTNTGFEGIYAKDNWNYSRSLGFQFMPKSADGLAVNYKHDSGFNAGVYAYDGADTTAEADNQKAYSFQLGYGMDNWSVTYNYWTDRDGTVQTAGNKRVDHNIVATFDLNSQWSFALNYLMGEVDEDANDTAWTNYAVYAKYQHSDNLYFALRYDMWENDDKAGAASFVDDGVGTTNYKLTGITLTGSYMCDSGSEFRLEVRQDSSDEEIYTDDEGEAQDNEMTVALAWIHSF